MTKETEHQLNLIISDQKKEITHLRQENRQLSQIRSIAGDIIPIIRLMLGERPRLEGFRLRIPVPNSISSISPDDKIQDLLRAIRTVPLYDFLEKSVRDYTSLEGGG